MNTVKIRNIILAVLTISIIGIIVWIWFGQNSSLNSVSDLTMTTINGRTIHLSRYRGHPVLLNFWATTCPGCVAEIPQLNNIYRQLHAQGFEIIGIAMNYDPAAQVRAMRQSLHIPYPIVIDHGGHLAKRFSQVRLTPTSFLINPKGHIVFSKIGELNFKRLRQRLAAMGIQIHSSAQSS